MDKVFQILIVFGLVTLFIYRFIRGREQSYRPYEFILRLRAPLAVEVEQRLIIAAAEEGFRLETEHLLFHYRPEGSLTIYRRRPQGRDREVQEMAVPVECTAMGIDPVEGRLYLAADGYVYVYGQA